MVCLNDEQRAKIKPVVPVDRPSRKPRVRFADRVADDLATAASNDSGTGAEGNEYDRMQDIPFDFDQFNAAARRGLDNDR
jgi:hypothetical protein